MKKIVVVSSCPTGVAHTYMAGQKLENVAQANNMQIKVEYQGAAGIENELTKQDIAEADLILLSNAVVLENMERFSGYNVVFESPQNMIKNAEQILKNEQIATTKYEALESSKSAKKGNKKGIINHMMAGVGQMIPVLLAGGLLIAVAAILASFFGDPADFMNEANNQGEGINTLIYWFGAAGYILLKFIYPFFAMGLAESIGGKMARVPAFLGGFIAAGLHDKFYPVGVEGFVPSGYFGALAIGFLVGYLVLFLNRKINFSKNLMTLKTMLIIPLIAGSVTILAMIFLITPIFGALNAWLIEFFTMMGTYGELAYATFIAGGTAFDLGGPINKAAGSVALGLNGTAEAFNLTARTLAIIIPPIGLGVSTMIDRLIVGRRLYDDEFYLVGKTSALLGCLGISEGALPFMFARPLVVIPINIIGAIIGAWTAILLGAIQHLPLPAIWGWPLAESPFAYIAGLIVGVVFVAITNVLVLNILTKKNK